MQTVFLGGNMGDADAISSIQAANWRDLYLAALFEINKAHIPLRIEEAEKAIMARSRELMSASNDTRERKSLDSALLALRALRTCVGEGDSEIPRRESTAA